MAQPTYPSGTASPSPVAIISPQYCAPHPLDLSIVEKVQMFTSGFDVTDVNGNLVFKVRDKLTWGNAKKSLLDPVGNPIVTFRQKGMSLHNRWQVFRGKSTDKKDLIFTAKTHSVFYLKPKLDVFLANNKAEEVCDFQVKGSSSNRYCTVYSGDESSKTIVAEMHKKRSGSFFFGKDKLMVTISPKMDYAFIVALVVILYDINHSGSSTSAGASGAAASSAASTF